MLGQAARENRTERPGHTERKSNSPHFFFSLPARPPLLTFFTLSLCQPVPSRVPAGASLVIGSLTLTRGPVSVGRRNCIDESRSLGSRDGKRREEPMKYSDVKRAGTSDQGLTFTVEGWRLFATRDATSR